MDALSLIKKTALFLCLCIVNQQYSWANQLDPLSEAEILSAQLLSTPTHQNRRSPEAQSVKQQGNELLLIERRPTDKDNPNQRLADVFEYDYSQDETIHTVVDLNNETIISSQRQQYLQLPLTAGELDRASDIIFADPEQYALIKAEYRRITSQYLFSKDQLYIKAFVFTADTLPGQLNAASKQCGLHRCAQILMYTHDSIVFEISPIVNLSAGIVTQNIGY